MHLYLIRHGIAAEPEAYATDEERPLTKEGDRKTRKVAQRLYELEIQFDRISSFNFWEFLNIANCNSKLKQFFEYQAYFYE